MSTLRSFICVVATAMLAVFIASVNLWATETVLLTGTVVDDDGKPVAGADVYFGGHSLTEMLDAKWSQRSDEHGRFALPVPIDRFNNWTTVYASSPEKERLTAARLNLKEGILEIPELTLTLKQARIITGTVTDANGNPVEGAVVGGTWDIPYPSVTLTDKEGCFRFAYPEDGVRTLQQVFAIHKELGMDYIDTEEGRGYRSATPPEKIKDGPFALKLIRWQTYSIRVVDEHQTPMSGIKVFAWLQRKPDAKTSLNIWSLVQPVTDRQGITAVPSISERMYFVAVPPDEGILMADGNRLFFSQTDKLSSNFAPSEVIPTLVLERLANVKGTVKRTDGTPVAWSRITISRHNGCGHGIQWTDAKGEFGIPRKAGELFDIGVESKLGATPGVFAFNVGDGVVEKRLDFVLEKGIRLHGTVYNPDGTPSEKYQIFLKEKCPPSLLGTIQTALGTTIRTALGTKPNAETCPPGGCPEGVVIRQTSDYDEPDSGGKYEYLLPAVRRTYDISVSSYTNSDVFFELKDYSVNGDEDTIELDFHLKPR